MAVHHSRDVIIICNSCYDIIITAYGTNHLRENNCSQVTILCMKQVNYGVCDCIGIVLSNSFEAYCI